MPRDEPMLRAERTCGQAEGPLKHLLGLRIVAAIPVEDPQAFHQGDEIRMLAAEDFLLDLERAPVATLRQRVIACFLGDDSKIAERVGTPQALGSIQLLAKSQRPSVEFFGASIISLPPVDETEVVQREGGGGMRGAKRLFTNPQRSLVKVDRTLVVPSAIAEETKIGHIIRHLRMIRSQHAFPNGQGPPMPLFGEGVVVG